MKKTILNLGKSLDKNTQKNINGGSDVRCFPTPTCFGYFDGIDSSSCGTCAQYHDLPYECRIRVKVSVFCFPI
ncbi:hypothetical protein [uncultured Tenacibaculum sp.]|uniref:hypothetical protein n=1 Tax=uncultured Tenacibaculum sp. TaxID=174713 RepID=UPI00261B7111|nr:hypothetical protein [uncultured Tenacibaculum sp.]